MPKGPTPVAMALGVSNGATGSFPYVPYLFNRESLPIGLSLLNNPFAIRSEMGNAHVDAKCSRRFGQFWLGSINGHGRVERPMAGDGVGLSFDRIHVP